MKSKKKKEIELHVVGSKSFRPDIQKPRQMENAVKDIYMYIYKGRVC